jgi:hypothetical protein
LRLLQQARTCRALEQRQEARENSGRDQRAAGHYDFAAQQKPAAVFPPCCWARPASRRVSARSSGALGRGATHQPLVQQLGVETSIPCGEPVLVAGSGRAKRGRACSRARSRARSLARGVATRSAGAAAAVVSNSITVSALMWWRWLLEGGSLFAHRCWGRVGGCSNSIARAAPVALGSTPVIITMRPVDRPARAGRAARDARRADARVKRTRGAAGAKRRGRGSAAKLQRPIGNH